MAKEFSEQIRFHVKFDGTPAQEIKLNAYLFNSNGKLLASAPVLKEEVAFDYKAASLRNLRIFIAPHVEQKPVSIQSIADLTRLKAYEPVLNINENRSLNILPVPAYYWRWWCWQWCRARGRVVKDFNFNGTVQEKAVCNARIHICEVDKLCFWISKIPDHIIDRIKKNFVDGPVHPAPGDPVERIQSLAINRANIFAPQNQQLAVKDLPIDIKSKFMVSNNDLVRTAIVDHFDILRDYFCYWPWFWPWFFKCSPIDTVYSDANGYFDTSFIHFNCCHGRQQHINPCCDGEPDLYFWIEYQINGVWTTVYKPCLPTHTFWNYACGSDITLRVTDARVPWGCHNQIEGDTVWVKSIGGSASVTHIEQDDTASTNAPAYNDVNFFPAVPFKKVGLSDASVPGSANGYGDNRRPFAGSIRFIVQFGSSFPVNGIKYYRWSWLKTANADLTATGNTLYNHPITTVVNKPYQFSFIDGGGIRRPGGTASIQLGPLTAGGQDGLYLIPPNLLPGTTAPFLTNPVIELDPFWDYDTETIYFDTNALDGDGLYDFKLELFDAAANLVEIPKTEYNIPVNTFPSPKWDASLSIWRLSQQAPNAYLVPGVPSTNAAGYHMKVRIDNNPAVGGINMVEILSGGTYVPTAPNCCGFVQYDPAQFNNSNLLKISFSAYQHYNFADLSFGIQRGTCNDVVQRAATDTAAMVMGDTNNSYQRDAAGTYFKTFSPATLLGTCSAEKKAAFAEVLTVQPLAINGDSQVFPNISPVAAFAIEPIAP